MIQDELRVRSFVLRRELGNIVPFVVIPRAEFPSRPRFVSAEISNGRVAQIFHLLFQWQLEKGLADGILPVDLLVCEAVAGHVEESYLVNIQHPIFTLCDGWHLPFLLMNLSTCAARASLPPG